MRPCRCLCEVVAHPSRMPSDHMLCVAALVVLPFWPGKGRSRLNRIFCIVVASAAAVRMRLTSSAIRVLVVPSAVVWPGSFLCPTPSHRRVTRRASGWASRRGKRAAAARLAAIRKGVEVSAESASACALLISSSSSGPFSGEFAPPHTALFSKLVSSTLDFHVALRGISVSRRGIRLSSPPPAPPHTPRERRRPLARPMSGPEAPFSAAAFAETSADSGRPSAAAGAGHPSGRRCRCWRRIACRELLLRQAICSRSLWLATGRRAGGASLCTSMNSG